VIVLLSSARHLARSAAALIISKWAGHYDSSFTMRTYVHASDDDLKQGCQALAKIHRIV
jgi:integrase